ncbi:MAG: pyridoxal phosphate-dependent aminotransferase [Treponema sp.]|nr:pyridoxal phosphate-dependent aminotransferase [Treponema sp.]
MSIALEIKAALGTSSLIRKMFEEGMLLKREHGAENVFDFSLGNPDIDPPPAFREVLLRLARESGNGSHGYTPNAGLPFVREALAKKAAREQGVPVGPGNLILVAGAAAGLNVVLKSVCNRGDEIVVIRPYFVEYRPYAANHGARLVETDSLPDFNLDVAAIERALSPKTAAVIVNSPNNPSGKIYPKETLAALAAALTAHGAKTGRLPYLVSDEPYREISYGPEVPSVMAAYRQSIVVYSYSKSLSLPGERIGYVAVHPEIDEAAELVNALVFSARVLGFVNAPALMQRAVAELVDAAVDVGVYAQRRDAFMEVLDGAGIGYAVPEGAFYLFAKVPPRKADGPADDMAFADHLKRHLIIAVPGVSFGQAGWLRFAYCMDRQIILNSRPAFMRAMESW